MAAGNEIDLQAAYATDAPSIESKASPFDSMLGALKLRWPEYLMEAFGLGVFMVSACMFATLLQHPSSPVRQQIFDPVIRRVLMGMAMGLTAIGIVFSPWGKQSGAHINPSFTLTFARLGKVKPWDAVFYIVSQFAGAITGVYLSSLVLGNLISHPSINYAATIPGSHGVGVAFVAEAIISFILMTVVLNVSNAEKLARYTGFFAGALVMTYISIEDPFSGMSMNPARTFSSALPARAWTALWIYFTAPPVGMLLAAEVYIRTRGTHKVFCAKYHHHNNKRCIFRCRFGEMETRKMNATGTES